MQIPVKNRLKTDGLRPRKRISQISIDVNATAKSAAPKHTLQMAQREADRRVCGHCVQ
jgi:hypothetical protein